MLWNNLFYTAFNQPKGLFLESIKPKCLKQSELIAWSSECADLLQVNIQTADWLKMMDGFYIPKEAQPCATVYSGHQFGHWAGQLGDGRALLLGSIQLPSGDSFELQLKGSGHTPYSRGGDGMAVLRASIREFLCSEAMAGLGIPTTRALALAHSTTPVIREQLETAAVVLRVAHSFIRFGHFEHFSANRNPLALQQLVNYVAEHYYPEAAQYPANSEERTLLLFDLICKKTATLIAHWQSVGFCHGVMNTDNMSILGLTLDYGPFGFLDTFDINHICNHSDTQGRYSYAKQPYTAQWNLACLAQSLSVLLHENKHQHLSDAIHNFANGFTLTHTSLFLRKLGLSETLAPTHEGQNFIASTLAVLQNTKADMTIFFRQLSHSASQTKHTTLQSLADTCIHPAHPTLIDWFNQYEHYQQQHLHTTGISRSQLSQSMLNTNPKYILRNYLAETAIKKARDEQDFSEIKTLLSILSKPFEEQPQHEAYAAVPPAWASELSVSCSS